MIRDLASEGVLVATVALAAMPLVARRFRRAFHPVELTRYNSATTGAGLSLLFVALVACALPVVGSLVGVGLSDRHFFPGDAVVGWLSVAVAVAVSASAVVGFRRFRRMERLLSIEPGLGVHVRRSAYDLVVLPTDELLAYANSGTRPQVVVTAGLVRRLSVAELVSVIEHEAAHIELGHRSHLSLLAMIDTLAVALPPIRRLVDTSRLALERAADSITSDHAATRAALVSLSAVPAASGVAAFTAGDIVERLEALDPSARRSGSAPRVALYSAAIVLAGASLATLGIFWF